MGQQNFTCTSELQKRDECITLENGDMVSCDILFPLSENLLMLAQ